MTKLFDAKEAKTLSKHNDPNGLLEVILEEIKERALAGHWDYTTRSYGFGSGELYDVEANYPPKIRKVLNSLRDLGFDADVKGDCRQFVDIYLYVSWHETEE